MNDQFLRNYHREPVPELADKVYGRISHLDGNVPLENPIKVYNRGSRQLRVVLTAGLAAFILLLLTTIFSPDARALMEDMVHQIGESLVRETAIYPFSGDADIVTSDYLTLEEAREAVDFNFSLPADLPERYVLLEEIMVTPGMSTVLIRWDSPVRGDGLILHISPHHPEAQFLVGPDGLEIVQVNGEDAMFIRGGWLENTQSWDPTIGREVRWIHNDLTYSLSTGNICPDEPENRCPLSDEDLIHIAESVP